MFFLISLKYSSINLMRNLMKILTRLLREVVENQMFPNFLNGHKMNTYLQLLCFLSILNVV